MRTDRCASPPPCRDRRAGSSRLARVAWCALLLAWLLWLLRSVLRFCRVRTRDRDCDRTNVPPWAVRKPDPMIYSQTFLQSQGLAVTWDNPDIHVERASNPGVPVDSHALAPDTDHVVVARVWNGSAHAPVVELPVELAYLEFGINTVRHDVAVTTVDLAVKGAVGCPAFAAHPVADPADTGALLLAGGAGVG